MADDTPILDGNAVVEKLATDELATYNALDVSAANPRIKAQRVKVGYGSDGVFTDVDTTNRLPVDSEITTGDLDTGAGTDTRAVVGIARAESGGGVLVGSANPLPVSGPVDVNTLPGTSQTDIANTAANAATIAGAVSGGKIQVDVQTMPEASVATDSIGSAPLAETTLAGATPSKVISAASTNATSVKASVGKVFSIVAFNLNAAPRYLKLYDKASAPTVGTDTPKWVLMIPGNTAGAGFSIPLPMPLKFANGIALAITTGIADTDTGAVAANEIVVNLGWI